MTDTWSISLLQVAAFDLAQPLVLTVIMASYGAMHREKRSSEIVNNGSSSGVKASASSTSITSQGSVGRSGASKLPPLPPLPPLPSQQSSSSSSSSAAAAASSSLSVPAPASGTATSGPDISPRWPASPRTPGGSIIVPLSSATHTSMEKSRFFWLKKPETSYARQSSNEDDGYNSSTGAHGTPRRPGDDRPVSAVPGPGPSNGAVALSPASVTPTASSQQGNGVTSKVSSWMANPSAPNTLNAKSGTNAAALAAAAVQVWAD